MLFQSHQLSRELPHRAASPQSAPEAVTVFHIQLRQKVNFGTDRTIRVIRISQLVLEIEGADGGTFTVANNHFEWCGTRIRAMLQNGYVELTLPSHFADARGIPDSTLVPA